MLISREKLRYDFGTAAFDLESPADLRFLGWVFDQFLYGEVTGIQCGYWLYRAPTLAAATFLARQATEELSHVKRIRRIQSLLKLRPGPAHWAVRFLSTGMMGGDWGEHVCMEMAIGEGLVLSAFYALHATIPHPEIIKILDSAIGDEEKHVEFGEKETQAWIKTHPGEKTFLLAQAVVQSWALRGIKRRLMRDMDSKHPVFTRLPLFYDHALQRFEERVELLGLSDRPISQLSLMRKLMLVGSIPIKKITRKLFRRKQPLLTDTYLRDPFLNEPTTASPD